ncbi:DNA polymerase Y family protein [Sulfitobacter sp. LCG007]
MTPTPPGSRIVSIWLPDLTLERWIATIRQYRTLPGADVPVALSCAGPHGPVVQAVNTVARALGIRRGDRVVDAQAVHPQLHVESADLEGDAALMRRLVHWTRRWCPWTVQDGGDGLILDVTGGTHLFGGEAALLRDITRRFALQGLSARVAIAPTRGAAQALARYGETSTICGATDPEDHLSALPVAALRLDAGTQRLLNRLGLKTIGQLAGMPRVTLMRRFSTLPAERNPLVLLDRAMGRAADPLNAPPDRQRFLARTSLPEPVIDPYPHLAGLAEKLCEALAKEEKGARHMMLTIYRIDSECRTVRLSLARASRDPAHLRRLFNGKLDHIDPGFGFDLLTLEATGVEPLPLVQESFGGKASGDADVAGLLDRLTARLGRDRVTWSVWNESHLPERVEGRTPALTGAPAAAPAMAPLPARERPLRLFDPAEEVTVVYAVPEGPPLQFRWRRALYRTMRHAGPERIAPEWWRDRPGTRLRDYYKVEVQDGRRFWIYREGLLQDGRGGDPRWFLQGLFA